MKLFWKIFLKFMGWTSEGEFPHLSKYIIIVGPHTSNQDFVLSLAYRSVLNISKARFLGKESLFKPPLGKLFIKMGGIPVKRDTSNKMVQQVVEYFNKSEQLIIALSPEGTRKKTERLKTGFYHIAKQANIPIVMAAMDYKEKKLIVSEPFFTSDNEKEDFRNIIKFFASVKGKVPENGFAHLLDSPLYSWYAGKIIVIHTF